METNSYVKESLNTIELLNEVYYFCSIYYKLVYHRCNSYYILNEIIINDSYNWFELGGVELCEISCEENLQYNFAVKMLTR